MEDVKREQEIIKNVVLNSREELKDILDNFTKNVKEHNIRNRVIDDIIEHFVKIVFKLNRFNEFKSKFKIVGRGERISKKEFERCNFIIKFSNNKISILKNNVNDIKGVFVKNVK